LLQAAYGAPARKGSHELKEEKVAWLPNNKIITSAVILQLGALILASTAAVAEQDVNAALLAYDSGDATDRKSGEVAFVNEENGIWWANSRLIFKKQQPLFCPPDNSSALPGAEMIEIVRRYAKENPKARYLPYGLVILMTLENAFPCKD
jgi:hypothetical protein